MRVIEIILMFICMCLQNENSNGLDVFVLNCVNSREFDKKLYCA